MNELLKNTLFEDSVSGGFLSEENMIPEIKMAAGLLKAFHVGRQDTVGLLLSNWVTFFIFFLGAKQIGSNILLFGAGDKRNEITTSIGMAMPKMLIIEEKFVWDNTNKRPSVLLREISQKFPDVRVIVTGDDKKADVKEKGAGFCGSFSWKTLRQFIEPYNAIAPNASSGLIICGARKENTDAGADDDGFKWLRVENGTYRLVKI